MKKTHIEKTFTVGGSVLHRGGSGRGMLHGHGRGVCRVTIAVIAIMALALTPASVMSVPTLSSGCGGRAPMTVATLGSWETENVDSS